MQLEDPLNWKDTKTYKERLVQARKKTGQNCAVMIAKGQINGIEVTAGAVNFEYIGGSFGAASGEDNSVAASVDITNMYVTYTMDAFSVGYQASEADSETASSDKDFTAIGLSYAVSDEMSVSYNMSTIEYEDTTLSDQEATGVSVSYVMGSMTLTANANSVDNIAGSAADNRSGYGMSLAFAF